MISSASTVGEGAIPLIDPADYARMVKEISDDQLRAGLAAHRELILGEIFRRMPEQLRADRAQGVNAVVEWRILDAPGEDPGRWQVEIRDGACTVTRDGDQPRRVAFTLGAVDFIKLVTGNVSGPKLFLLGRLKVDGDLVLGARMPAMFALP